MKDPRLQPINVLYNRALWADFRRMAKDKYDLDGATAIKKLIDHALRTKTIPGVEPRFDYVDGVINDKPQTRPTDGGGRRTGFSHLRRGGLIISGDVVATDNRLPLILPE